MKNAERIRPNENLLDLLTPYYVDLFDTIKYLGEMPKTIDPVYKTYKLGGQVNLITRANEYLIEIVAPGYTKEDLKIEFKDSNLKITGNSIKKDEKKDNEYFTRKEFAKNSFVRELTVPKDIVGNITANFENGILSISIERNVKKTTDTSVNIEIQ